MAESYSVTAVLSAIDKNFSAIMEKAASQTASFSEKVESVTAGVGRNMAIVGGATTALGVSSVKSFGDFQASLNKAAVTAGGTSKDISGLADVANKMGADLPLSAQDSADAMIEMAQAGADVSQIKEQFPAIAEAATAAGSDLIQTAGVVQNAMNIWGDSLKSPKQAAADLTLTANASNASVEDMQQALATIGGTAKASNMSLQTTSTAIGLLTNRGYSAAQASQDLNHAILQMQAPSKVAQGAMSDLGLSFTDAQGNMKPFPTILQDISKSMDGMTSADKQKNLKALFGTAGMQAIGPLLDSINDKSGSVTKSWDGMFKEIQDGSGSVSAASKTLSTQASEMQQNIGSKIEQIGGNWEALRNKAMDSKNGVVGSMIDMVNNTITWATTSNSAIAEVIRGFIGLSPVLGPVLLAFGGLVIVIGKVVSSISSIASALSDIGSLLANPWTLAIVAVGAALWAFFTKTEQGKAMWQSFSTFLIGLWNAISPALIATWNALSAAFAATWQALVTIIQPIIQSIITIFTQLAPILVPIIQGLGLILVTTFTGIVTGVAGILQVLLTVISGTLTVIATVWSAVWNSMSAVVGTIFTVIGTLISTALQVIIGVITVALDLITGNWSGAWNAIKGIASAVWNGIKTIISSVLSTIKTIIMSGVSVIKAVWNAGINALKAVVTAVWNSIKAVFNAGVAFIKSVVHIDLGKEGEAIMNSFLNGLKRIWTSVKDFVGGIGSWIKQHKGPISYDRRLLIPHGKAIMLGFNEGLMKQFSDVQSNVSAMAGQVADSMQISMPSIDTTQMDSSLNRLPSLSSASLSGSVNGSVSLEDTTVSQQNNALLRRIADKDTNLYMDSDTLVGTTSDKFNGQLGATSNNDERWSW
ncbi:phage tail tape measure protein [Pediococcus pentosaceus]|uniref:phage tail tape measure protein n=1 Tax=Pediococcus pentosaceus TaxID=1255 RepID=UPI0013311062|nr:phage tail tape measure protein [Pediococcus pentosaceus]KAF0349768.1 phage tail tape measure protein [Pediococcus pentosaceus]MBF7105672.1 phage tail tape measure protein [Pediococcus pentosaceus]